MTLSRLAGLGLGILTRLWLATLRTEYFLHPDLERYQDRPWVLALWHSQILPLLSFRRRKQTVALVSLSRDGEILCGAFLLLGLGVARGSSSKAGRHGLAALVGKLREGNDAAIAVDGPKGPRFQVRAGAMMAAKRSCGVVVPFAAVAKWKIRLRRSWDHFEVPLPFSKVRVVLGPPIVPSDETDLDVQLAQVAGALHGSMWLANSRFL